MKQLIVSLLSAMTLALSGLVFAGAAPVPAPEAAPTVEAAPAPAAEAPATETPAVEAPATTEAPAATETKEEAKCEATAQTPCEDDADEGDDTEGKDKPTQG